MTPVPLALLQGALRGTVGQLTVILTLFGAKDGCNKYVELALYTLYMLVCRERQDHEVIAWKLQFALCSVNRDGSAAPGSCTEFARIEASVPPQLSIGGA